MKLWRSRLTAGLCAAVLAVSLCTPALATSGSKEIEVTYSKYKVTLDGKPLYLKDANGKKVDPFSYHDSIYLPVRAVASALGLEVYWLPGNNTIALTTGGQASNGKKASSTATKTLRLTAVYSDIKLTLDNQPLIPLDKLGKPVEPFAIDGTTYLPLRAVANAMGLEVEYLPGSNTVALTSAYPAFDPKKATTFLKGMLDNLYLGKYDGTFLDMAGNTERWAKQVQQEKLDFEVTYFGRCFDIPSLMNELDDIDTQAAREAMKKFYLAVFAKAKYTVGSAAAEKDGSFTVKVTVSPLNILTKFTEEEKKSAWAAALSATELTQEQADLLAGDARTALDLAYTEAILKILDAKRSGMGHLSSQTVEVKIQRDKSGAYFLSEDDFDQIDRHIIEYPV